jgi:hypothetical protein
VEDFIEVAIPDRVLHLGRLDLETKIVRRRREPHLVERRFRDDYSHELRGVHEAIQRRDLRRRLRCNESQRRAMLCLSRPIK